MPAAVSREIIIVCLVPRIETIAYNVHANIQECEEMKCEQVEFPWWFQLKHFPNRFLYVCSNFVKWMTYVVISPRIFSFYVLFSSKYMYKINLIWKSIWFVIKSQRNQCQNQNFNLFLLTSWGWISIESTQICTIRAEFSTKIKYMLIYSHKWSECFIEYKLFPKMSILLFVLLKIWTNSISSVDTISTIVFWLKSRSVAINLLSLNF